MERERAFSKIAAAVRCQPRAERRAFMERVNARLVGLGSPPVFSEALILEAEAVPEPTAELICAAYAAMRRDMG